MESQLWNLRRAVYFAACLAVAAAVAGYGVLSWVIGGVTSRTRIAHRSVAHVGSRAT